MECSADSQDCVEETSLRLASLAWRRPLDPEETEALQTFIASRARASSPREALESVIPVLLEAVDFVYFTEVGDADANAPEGMRALLPHELAQRLSLFFWDEPADDTLASEVATLTSDNDYRDFIDSVFDDERSERGLERFASQWMPLTPGRLDGKFPTELMNELGVELSSPAHAAFRETLRMAALTLARQAFRTGTMRDLFGGHMGYVNDVIAPIYGIGAVGSPSDLVAVEFEANERAGILTEPAVLADVPGSTRFPSIFRAVMILSQVTCGDPGQPDFASIQTRVDGEAGPVSLRRQLEEGHLASGCGGSCHTIIDNLGFPFNRYDVHGRYQTTETYNYTAPGGGARTGQLRHRCVRHALRRERGGRTRSPRHVRRRDRSCAAARRVPCRTPMHHRAPLPLRPRPKQPRERGP